MSVDFFKGYFSGLLNLDKSWLWDLNSNVWPFIPEIYMDPSLTMQNCILIYNIVLFIVYMDSSRV